MYIRCFDDASVPNSTIFRLGLELFRQCDILLFFILLLVYYLWIHIQMFKVFMNKYLFLSSSSRTLFISFSWCEVLRIASFLWGSSSTVGMILSTCLMNSTFLETFSCVHDIEMLESESILGAIKAKQCQQDTQKYQDMS